MSSVSKARAVAAERQAVAAPISKAVASSGGCTPARIIASSVGINEPVIAMGTSGGVISPPAGSTMWYTGSPRPGQSGVSVLAGHVTWNGPDTFYNLDRIGVGGRLVIQCTNGKSLPLQVTRTASERKAAVATDSSVWGGSSTPMVAIITCDRFSPMTAGHHWNNFILWAKTV